MHEGLSTSPLREPRTHPKVQHFIGWTRSGSGRGDVIRYHLKPLCNTITSFCGGGIGKDATTGMYNTTPYVLTEYEL